MGDFIDNVRGLRVLFESYSQPAWLAYRKQCIWVLQRMAPEQAVLNAIG